ncbi:hypothetical protein M1446_02965 [Candidatus Dependentiae bacterium]|nr:hypothetical protein [Candidatus Dependentiae bacterium]
MCFSLKASLIASSGLMVLGYFSLKEIKARRQILFAGVPLLFSIQQLSEGILWAYMNGLISNIFIKNFAVYFFLTFVLLIWPFYMPLSIYFLERKKLNKQILLGITIFGTCFSVFLLFYLIKYGADVTILGNSICYQIYLPEGVDVKSLMFYVCAVVAPFFISTVSLMPYFGFALLASCIFAYYFWFATFISVWCFFGAILSCFVIWILKRINRRK